MTKNIAIIFSLLLVSASMSARTQEKHLRPFVELGAGLSYVTNNGYEESETGMGLSLSAGLDIDVGNNWSIAPSIGHIDMIGDAWHLFRGYIGCDYDIISMFDCSVLGNYHFSTDGVNYTFGVGPALYFIDNDERYYIDADPDDPRSGLPKNHKSDIGLRFSFSRDLGGHWYLGVQANAGLRNIMIQHQDCGISGNKHLFTALITAGFKF